MSYQTPPVYSPISFSSSSSPSSSDTSAGASAPRTKRARVSAEHTLNRVRENQRRHRARQRDHVTSLELKLAETERLLVEARAEIALLRQQAAERDEYNGRNMKSGILEKDIISITPPTYTSIQNQTALFLIPAQNDNNNSSNSNPTSQNDDVYPDISQLPDLSFFADTTTTATTITTDSTYFLSPLTLPTDLSLALALPSPSPSPSTPPSLDLQDAANGPPPCCSDPPPSSPSDPECTTCKTRPPPSPTESTTLCAQAYVLIRQQNFRNLDPHTIRLWLAQGLRRAQREGEGCRVENGALLRLLDFISGV
ncbi:hypothetical protein COCSADRAFT_320487 [Bipolaris sorokiniana ND90Pr]|uniref:BZIP domain-containing protein n=1 Tax=Cochliobolus sativus (strain ND90Pr / ATCC 201652) TaxID=665912 RepID=M2T467_COCSN|nr:uncharacterized protein COCSADRAFT_320487 [Bipolaris sorokiniana ND90Pr]EMD64046.1 hypothetical protein COCSADRAFT_320487 [Bipolaris sorokiniana ND90Pr]